ncbi:DUF6089 family protein [Flavobacterium sp. '19STA2R22 D10 B1']|uniref:type IX secretion system protein PorG n=1 Tax=Flavobacterium aerium TaxID=3037261 RepID=UPI00278BD80D|nr:DUF6089 family protein [Flavobacterium sp. '19STA2R22 D10 B1']
MNRKLLTFFCFFTLTFATAQIHEVGVFLGGSNYIGEVGPTSYISPDHLALGVLYKWNKSPRHSYRISYTQSKISSNDLNSDSPARKQRGYAFENNIKELSLGLEFNFFDFNLHEPGFIMTPYVYTGLSYFSYNTLYVLNGKTREDDHDKSLAIPMTVGIKARIADQFVLGFEVSARYTFTDNLDGSYPKDDKYKSLRFGNLNSNDWYVFSGFTLTYTFGNKPCYCAE